MRVETAECELKWSEESELERNQIISINHSMNQLRSKCKPSVQVGK